MNYKLTSDLTTRNLKASQGLSLIELLVTLSIISILLCVGLPSFTKSIDKNRIQSATYDLLTAIQTTRQLAVTRQMRAVLRANNQWHDGWELFVDTNDNGKRETDEQLLFSQPGIPLSMLANTNSMKTISFINTGESRQAKGSAGGSFLAGSISICDKSGHSGYKLILARGGRTRISKISCP